MSELCSNDVCTGCFACFNACKFGAVEIKINETGELYPEINREKCRQCGLCEKVCPVMNDLGKNPVAQQAVAAYTNDLTDRSLCSSGGFATGLYKKVLSEGGAVFGAGFNDDGMPILKCAESFDEIKEFAGSKYVYAFPDKIYQKVKEKLDEGKKCLFISVPCQVSGLKSFLKNDYANLVTADIICHGTPPYEFLKNHIEQNTSKQNEGHTFSFRGKKDFYLTVYNKGKEIYSKKSNEDYYFQAFLSGLIHRENCYKCPFACNERTGDLTIGDFWGLNKDALNGYKGRTSVVLINTEKGKTEFDNIKDGFTYEIRPVDEALKGNEQLNRPSVPHSDRDSFISCYRQSRSFLTALEKTSIVSQVNKTRSKNRIMFVPRKIKHILFK